MRNNDNDWDRDRRSENQDWKDDFNGYNRSRSYGEARNEYQNNRPRYDDFGRESYGNDERRGYYGNSYNRDMEDNDRGDNRGRYGNSTPVNRGSSNYPRGRDEDWNRRGRDYRDGRSHNDDDRNWWDKTKDEVSSWFGDEDAERRRKTDERQSHKGRGPKGYTRSDDRIKEDVNDRLTDDPHIDASDIEVSVSNGEVTLTGTVENRFAKRHAEDLAERISGVKDVENRIKIRANQQGGNRDLGNVGSGNSELGNAGSGNRDYRELNNTGTSTTHQDTPGSSGAFPVGAFDTSKD
jgi:osmotically-inducible protein OsmY